ncbi:GNAT family N-acetyltransferase [Nocardia xishanensis]|uniref:GNAT family N-acetyltransferase n=1 Tax=Nocardia xishanensis TaxID=238964 RepID=UPI0033E31C56
MVLTHRATGQRNLVSTTAGLLVAEHSSAGIVATVTAALGTTDVASITMMVASSHRGQGIGTALLERLIDWCDSNNAHKVTLQVWPHNLPATGLYHRAGSCSKARCGHTTDAATANSGTRSS